MSRRRRIPEGSLVAELIGLSLTDFESRRPAHSVAAAFQRYIRTPEWAARAYPAAQKFGGQLGFRRHCAPKVATRTSG
jgi:hypothetical protein